MLRGVTPRPKHETARLDDLRVFAALAQTRSFTRAGQALGLPKQTVSRRIAQLEARLGCRLVLRSPAGLSLTPPGEAYALRCAEVVALAEAADAALADLQATPQGTLRVTADPVFGEAFLGPVLLEFAQRWPAVRVDVLLTRAKLDLAREGVDVAFRIGPVDGAELTAVRLGEARVFLCASPGYLAARGAPADAAALSGHDCVGVVDDGPLRWPLVSMRGRSAVVVDARLQLGSLRLVHEAVRRGLGIGLLPEFLCGAELRSGDLRPVLMADGCEVGGIWLVHPARRTQAAKVRAFVALAKRHFVTDSRFAAALRAHP